MVIMECIKILPVYHHFRTRDMIDGVVGGWLDLPEYLDPPIQLSGRMDGLPYSIANPAARFMPHPTPPSAG